MTKLILILALFTGLWADKYPKDIAGKWMVENLEPGDAAKNIPEDKREMMIMMATEIFRTAVFEFKADHTCAITASVPNIPKSGKWEYDAKTGIIKITGQDQNGKPGTLTLNATEKGGKVFFTFPKSPMVLTMHKK